MATAFFAIRLRSCHVVFIITGRYAYFNMKENKKSGRVLPGQELMNINIRDSAIVLHKINTQGTIGFRPFFPQKEVVTIFEIVITFCGFPYRLKFIGFV